MGRKGRFKEPDSSGQRNSGEKTGSIQNLSSSLNPKPVCKWPGAGWDQAAEPSTPTLSQPEEEVKVSEKQVVGLQFWLPKDPTHTREAKVWLSVGGTLLWKEMSPAARGSSWAGDTEREGMSLEENVGAEEGLAP